MQANGVNDVLRILDGIIADCEAKSDPLGYFPALYRQVTLTVKQGIAAAFFDDGPRMDRFDALFAKVAFLGKIVAQPTGIVEMAVNLIRQSESKDVPAIIGALNGIVPPTVL